MRIKPTLWELRLRGILTQLNYRFKSQVPIICRQQYGYIMDFVLTDFNIFIEVNSKKYHYSNKEQVKADNRRAKRISKEGYFPLVLTNSQVSVFTKEQIDSIIKTKISLIVNKS